MSLRTRHLFLWIALVAPSGCTVESENTSPFVPVFGEVTYQGSPLKRGAINLIPTDANGIAASGEILEGAIKNVTSRTRGDGAKVGKYRVTIIAIEDPYIEEEGKRTAAGPDPTSMAVLVSKLKTPIPPHYANMRSSGLTAEISPGKNRLLYHLKDEPTETNGPPRAD